MLHVAWSVCVCVLTHTGELCKNGWTDRDAVWRADSCGFKELCNRWGPDPPNGKGNIWGCGHVPVIGTYLRMGGLLTFRLPLPANVDCTSTAADEWMGCCEVRTETRRRCGLLPNYFWDLLILPSSVLLGLVHVEQSIVCVCVCVCVCSVNNS